MDGIIWKPFTILLPLPFSFHPLHMMSHQFFLFSPLISILPYSQICLDLYIYYPSFLLPLPVRLLGIMATFAASFLAAHSLLNPCSFASRPTTFLEIALKWHQWSPHYETHRHVLDCVFPDLCEVLGTPLLLHVSLLSSFPQRHSLLVTYHSVPSQYCWLYCHPSPPPILKDSPKAVLGSLLSTCSPLVRSSAPTSPLIISGSQNLRAGRDQRPLIQPVPETKILSIVSLKSDHPAFVWGLLVRRNLWQVLSLRHYEALLISGILGTIITNWQCTFFLAVWNWDEGRAVE